MNEIQKSYDELPYFSAAFPDCSPTRIEAIASFLSLTPPDTKTCRVLEIGCSYGGNLFPFAIANPNAQVVGIDLSGVQIEEAQKLAVKMGVDNIKFIQKDVCELANEADKFGKFDYIICHGVYSWVPNFVKDAILKSIKALLSPHGIAYVSYNVYPGWKIKDVIRDFLIFGTKDVKGEFNKAQKSRELLKFLQNYTKFCKENKDKFDINWINADLLLNHVSGILNINSDSYIVHEYLEEFNDPFYFKDFAKNLDDNGLGYLSNINLDDVFKSNLGLEEFDEYIDINFKDRIEKEQALDFMINKVFRQSLIVHKEILGDDFHVDIGVNELAKLHLTTAFSKTDDVYANLNGVVMNPKYNWLYQVFSDVYPASVNFAQVAALLDNDSAIQAAYIGFMEILSTNCAQMSVYERPKLEYEVGKTRLQERVRGYLEYFASQDKPVITCADSINSKVVLSNLDIFIALKFDGSNSIEKVAELAAKFVKDSGLHFIEKDKKIEPNDKNNFKKAAFDYVKNVEIKLCDHGFFESF